MKTLAIAAALSPVVLFALSLLYKVTGQATAVVVAWAFPAELLDVATLGVLAEYAAKRRKCIGQTARNWSSKYMFVQPAGEYRHVPFLYAWLSTHVMLFGRAVVVVHFSKGGVYGDGAMMVARYLRGSIDFKKLVVSAFADKSGAPELTKRFAVHNIPENGASPSEVKSASSSPAPMDQSQLVIETPVGYEHSELGVPVPTHPFDNYSESEKTRDVRKDFEFWLSRRRWYEGRGISWRRGYLLHGKPGTGKTSLVRSLAQEYDVPVYRFDLGALTTWEFRLNARNIQVRPAIFLFDDIDGIYGNREVPGTEAAPRRRDTGEPWAKSAPGVTFDGFLDVLDGVEQLDGVAVFVTTNYPDRLDAALTRPGRLDIHAEICGPDEAGRRKIVERIVEEQASVDAVLSAVPRSASPAVLREAAIEAALRDEWRKKQTWQEKRTA